MVARKGLLLVGAALVAGAGLLWQLWARSPQEVATMQVSLAIYSGRPDPSWLLSPTDGEWLRQRLANPIPFTGERTIAGLGYGGFMISDLSTAPQEQQIVRVYRGQIETITGSQVTVTADPDRQLERRLFATADRTVLNSDLYNIVTAALTDR